jgi:hydrogenase/urease accessory protein HupE
MNAATENRARRASAPALLLALLFAPSLFAHEMGATRVSAVFHRGGTYRMEITIDPQALDDRLTMLAERRRGSAPVEELRARIEARSALYLQQVEIRFDGRRVTPSFTYVPSAGSTPQAPAAVIRLDGKIPQHARSFDFRYALPYAPYLLTLHDEASPGPPSHVWVEGDAVSQPFSLQKRAVPLTRGEIVLLYLRLGFLHIIPRGLDHILFVLGIFLLSTRWRPLLAQVTAFTIAHSVTLALTIYGVVGLPSRLVETAIALSIAYIGVENIATRSVKPWRVGLVFGFGLLHGMGFAGVLTELGIPRQEFITAVIAFNIGVECGQLTVIGAAFLIIASWSRSRPWYRQRVVIPLSMLIAFVGLYWTLERALF